MKPEQALPDAPRRSGSFRFAQKRWGSAALIENFDWRGAADTRWTLNKSIKRMEARSLVETLQRTDYPFVHRAVSFVRMYWTAAAAVLLAVGCWLLVVGRLPVVGVGQS